jgi:hypothetical protein
MPSRWGYVGIVGLVIFNLGILGLTYHRYRLRFSLETLQVDENPPPYHSSVEPLIVRKLEHVVGGDWRYLLIAFVPPTEADPRLQYLNVLHRRYAEKGVKVIGLSGGPKGQVSRLIEKARINFPFISDQEFHFHRAFHIHPAHSHGGLVVLDKEGRIEFYTPVLPQKEELRQLAEKYALGEINYIPVEAPLAVRLKIGAPLPELALRRIDGRHSMTLGKTAAANLALVIFGAGCSSCQMDQLIEKLRLFRNTLRRDHPDYRLIIVFTAADDLASLASYQKVRALPAAAYRLEETSSLYDEYQTRYADTATRPIVVMTGKSGEIVTVTSLEEVIK